MMPLILPGQYDWDVARFATALDLYRLQVIDRQALLQSIGFPNREEVLRRVNQPPTV